MNLLAIIIVFLAIVTAGAIAYIAWELSSPPTPPTPPKAEGPADSIERSGDDRSGNGPGRT
jgi:hypothetical protein